MKKLLALLALLTFPALADTPPPVIHRTCNAGDFVNSIQGNQAVCGTPPSVSNTDSVPEGVTNLYFTNARARAAHSGVAPISYNSTTGAISCIAATGSVAGCLAAADFVTFNAKQNAITLGTTSQYFKGDLSLGTFQTDVRAQISGTAPIAFSGGAISCAVATGSVAGCLSAADFTTFAAKQGALTFGNLTAPGTDGIAVTGGTSAVVGSGTSIAQHVADSTHNGYLGSSDWSVFNAKEPSITVGTTLKYWRGDKTFQTLDTSVVPENGNLYYLDSRARAALSGTAPISYSSSTGVISCAVATGSVAGCLAAADFTTFNAKQAAGNYITATTGDVTATGPGSVAATIAANAVTNAKAAQMAAHTWKGNNTGSTANAVDATTAQVKSDLAIACSDLTNAAASCATDATNMGNASSGTLVYGRGGTGATSWTVGSVLYAGTSAFQQDNANFFWDATNHRLGLGTTSPNQQLELTGNLRMALIATSTTGIIYKGTSTFIHDFSVAGTTGLNTFVGVGAGNLTLTGSTTTGGSRNTVVGNGSAAALTTGARNVMVGDGVATSMTTAAENVCIGGGGTCGGMADFSDNVAIGYSSFNGGGAGTNNVFIGRLSGTGAPGQQNVAIGLQAMTSSGTNFATAIGSNALRGATNGGGYDVAVGYLAGYNVTSGGHDIFIGDFASAAGGITTGSNNILIGQDPTLLTPTSSDQLDIGNLLFGTGLGKQGTLSTGKIGIGVVAPAETLDVNGAVKNLGIKNAAAQTTLTGAAGTAICSEPEQGTSYKKVVCFLNGYTDTNTQTYTFPVAFSQTPYVYGSSSGVSGATTTTTTIKFTTTTISGFVFVEGY